MPVSVTLNLTAAVALAIQLLIFAYLYRSNRVRFFRYLVWAWGCYVGSKAFEAARYFTSATPGLGEVGLCLGVIGDFLILASALAFRWNYAIRPAHAFGVVAFAVAVSAHSVPRFNIGYGLHASGWAASGLIVMLAGVAFWPRRQEPPEPAGRRFLAVSLALWGLYRIPMAYVGSSSERVFIAANVTFVLVYYLVVFAIVIVVLDRARSEAAALKEFNERLIDGLGEGLQLVDDTFAVRHRNRWLTEKLAPTPAGRCYEALTADGGQCPGCPMAERGSLSAPVRLRVAGRGEQRFELTCSPVRQPDGQVFLLELVADVTEAERMRSRLTEAERLAALGELAASVAHEIRNPLSAIVNATALLEREGRLSDGDRAATIGAVKKEARRLNAILSDFLRFARPVEPKRVEGNLRDVVAHVAALIGEQQAAQPWLELQTRIEPSLPNFAFDPDQLTQVLWNVSLNAIEAMKGRGRLLIHGRRDGQEVVIEVADTGPGISPEDLRRVFEPFYSKRSSGTGLGLPIARRIVIAHGGRIEVDSVVGEGTRALIRLPFG
jgi:signal transduction histidine kinase